MPSPGNPTHRITRPPGGPTKHQFHGVIYIESSKFNAPEPMFSKTVDEEIKALTRDLRRTIMDYRGRTKTG